MSLSDSPDQLTLVPPNNLLISKNSKQVVFNKSTDFLENVTAVQLALAGFSLQNQLNLQYVASIKYSAGAFQVRIQAFNQTVFDYVSFFAIVFRAQARSYFDVKSFCQTLKVLNLNPSTARFELMSLTSSFNKTTKDSYLVQPYVRSMKCREGGNGYTRLKVSESFWAPFSTSLTILLQTEESLVTQACVTVVVLVTSAVGLGNYTYFLTTYRVRQFQAASIKVIPANFGIIASTYGPIYNKKCLVGFYNIYFRDGVKELFFDMTKENVTSIIQTTPQYFFAELRVFCVMRVKNCTSIQGVQTSLQECVNCSSMIKNCLFCKTQQECVQCRAGHFIDSSKKCCPNWLSYCTICSLGDSCMQCADGYYIFVQTGRCVSCSQSVTNCSMCRNSTFCYKCSNSFTLNNSTSCTLTESSSSGNTGATNSTKNQTSPSTNNSTDNSDKQNPSQGVTLWRILLFALAGVCFILLTVMVILCIKLRKNKSSQPIQVNKKPTYSLENNRVTTDREVLNTISNQPDAINQNDLKLQSGLLIRNGSRLQSITSNQPRGAKTFINEAKSTKDIKTVKDMQLSSNHRRSNDVISSNELASGGSSQRGLYRQSALLPQISKQTLSKEGGYINLKANFCKK